MNIPTVIWMGGQPLNPTNRRRYRLVYRGLSRPSRPDDVPFACEQRIGQSMMKRLNWDKPHGEGAAHEAVWALGHALGQLLMHDPADFCIGHPLHCEINMAIAEGRIAQVAIATDLTNPRNIWTRSQSPKN
jgi:hypothetical protein